MNTKVFVSLLTVILVLGVGLGGAFVGGIALGKSQVAEGAQIASSAAPTLGSAQQSFGALTPEQRAQFRQQFQAQQDNESSAQNSFGGGFSRRAGLTGAIEKVDGNTLTVNTPQGPLLATVTAETTIQKIAKVTVADLLAGMQVTVSGAPGEDGAMVASTIFVVPEGQDSIFGGRGSWGSSQQHSQQTP